ncbi:MAG: PQ-loop repeat-containing protein [Chitinophagaceae bacterium]|nr:PQ-loop repeat-containing protein [Chitinophagaceae bacterium]
MLQAHYLITFLPQVIRIWKTKSAKDLSINMLLLLMVGVSMRHAYGIFKKMPQLFIPIAWFY